MADTDARDGVRTLKYFAATFLIALAIGIVRRPDEWYVPFVCLGAVVAFAVIFVAAGWLWEGLRRCPRCAQRGFSAILESEKESPAGDLFYRVAYCRSCGLYRLECGAEVHELDPERWEEQVREWNVGPPDPLGSVKQ